MEETSVRPSVPLMDAPLGIAMDAIPSAIMDGLGTPSAKPVVLQLLTRDKLWDTLKMLEEAPT